MWNLLCFDQRMLMKNINKKLLKKDLSINNDTHELLLRDERILASHIPIYLYIPTRTISFTVDALTDSTTLSFVQVWGLRP